MNGNFIERNERGNEAYYNGERAGGGMDNIYDPRYGNRSNKMYNRDREYIERKPWNEERDRNWNIRGDREHRHDNDRNVFERMGDTIRNKWNEWTGNDERYREEEENRYRNMNRHGDVDADRSWNEDRDRARDERRRIYNADDYRTLGQRGGYIPEREMGSYLHDEMYDYGTGNYGAQGMGRTAYDQDFTYKRHGQNAGSGNIKGGYYYDRNNEPDFNRDRSNDYHDREHRNWRNNSSMGNKRDDVYAQRDRYSPGDDRYRGTNDRAYEDRDYTMHGERQFFGNDAYGVGVMGGYHDTFPEDFRYAQWRRGTK